VRAEVVTLLACLVHEFRVLSRTIERAPRQPERVQESGDHRSLRGHLPLYALNGYVSTRPHEGLS
jgi:hypothetical protein